MSTINVNPLGLLGCEISFKDLSFSRISADLDLPPDFPSELMYPVVTGLVQGFSFYVDLDMTFQVTVHVGDSDYSLSDIDQLSIIKH